MPKEMDSQQGVGAGVPEKQSESGQGGEAWRDFYKNPDNMPMVNAKGRMEFSSMASSGMEVIELPVRDKSTLFVSESVQVRHLPNHVVTRVEAAMHPGGNPASVLAHYAGCLQGAELVNKATSAQLDKLVARFSRTPAADQKQFFQNEIRPFFEGMKPGRRT